MSISIKSIINRARRFKNSQGCLALVALAITACHGAEPRAACMPDETSPCETSCGAGLRTCDDDGSWSTCLPTGEWDCLPGETGDCETSDAGLPGYWSCTDTCEMGPCEPRCEPGERLDCEAECGPGARRCDADGAWGPCVEYVHPSCRPGEIEVCLEGGVRRCDSSCRFGSCEEESSCSPGEEAACPGCGIQTCLEDGTWSVCETECIPGEQELCDEGDEGYCGLAVRTCTDLCMWSECDESIDTSIRGYRDGPF